MESFISLGCLRNCYAGVLHFLVDFSADHPIIFFIGFPLLLILLRDQIDRLIARPRIPAVEGRYVLVTGCARGFGRDIVLRLDALGCRVFAACRSERGMTELDQETSDRVEVIKMDISNEAEVRQAFSHIKDKIPAGQGLWGVVNNAAIIGSMLGPPDWLTAAAFREVLEVNLLGTIDVTMTFLPLIKQSKGRIVNISSVAGRLAPPLTLHYGASKYGVEGFSDGMRQWLRAFECKVILVEPGFFKTNIVDEEVICSACTNAWNSVPQEIKDEYGHDYVEKFTARFRVLSKKNFGNKISMVSDAVEQALFSLYPRARILVGNDSAVLYRFFFKMPEWMADRLLIILSGHPKPACTVSH